jgi:predicted GNAT superfamily acetyltransferase
MRDRAQVRGTMRLVNTRRKSTPSSASSRQASLPYPSCNPEANVSVSEEEIAFRQIEIEEDLRFAWALNQSEDPHVAAETWPEFGRLCNISAYARLAILRAAPAGFLLGMTTDADYDSPNFLFFRARYRAFLYVDRIAVAANGRRLGVGTSLYRDVETYARAAALTSICCEVNLRPGNPGSLSFHRELGFVQVGEQLAHGKTVAMLVKAL